MKKKNIKEGLFFIAGSLDTEKKIIFFKKMMFVVFEENADSVFDQKSGLMYVSKLFNDNKDVSQYFMMKSPKMFGPPVWKMLFTIASIVNREIFEEFVIIILAEVLPCGMCSKNWIKHIKIHPLKNEKTNKEFICWLYNMKFIINGTKPNFESILRLYLK